MAFTLDVGSAIHTSVVRQYRGVLAFLRGQSLSSSPSLVLQSFSNDHLIPLAASTLRTQHLRVYAIPHNPQVEAAVEAAKSSGETKGPSMVVQVVYLQSYDRMGRANASCSGGLCGNYSHVMTIN
jgi:hypothetical protein